MNDRFKCLHCSEDFVKVTNFKVHFATHYNSNGQLLHNTGNYNNIPVLIIFKVHDSKLLVSGGGDTVEIHSLKKRIGIAANNLGNELILVPNSCLAVVKDSGLLICMECHIGIYCSADVENPGLRHLKAIHSRVDYNPESIIDAFIQSNSQGIYSNSIYETQLAQNNMIQTPIAGLEILSGYQCSICQPDYFVVSMKSIMNHIYDEHKGCLPAISFYKTLPVQQLWFKGPIRKIDWNDTILKNEVNLTMKEKELKTSFLETSRGVQKWKAKLTSLNGLDSSKDTQIFLSLALRERMLLYNSIKIDNSNLTVFEELLSLNYTNENLRNELHYILNNDYHNAVIHALKSMGPELRNLIGSGTLCGPDSKPFTIPCCKKTLIEYYKDYSNFLLFNYNVLILHGNMEVNHQVLSDTLWKLLEIKYQDVDLLKGLYKILFDILTNAR